MRRAQIKLEDIRPGRMYYGYVSPAHSRRNDIICVEDGKLFKKVWQINTGLYLYYSKKLTIVSQSFPGCGLSYDTFFGYDYEDRYFNSTVNNFYYSFPILFNGSLDMVVHYSSGGSKNSPTQLTTGTRLHYSTLPNTTLNIFETYLGAVESVISDLEEILEKYKKTSEIIKSLIIKDQGENGVDEEEVSGMISRHTEKYIDKEVYLSIFNLSKVARTVDYFKILDPKSQLITPIKVKILGQTKVRGGYGIDMQTEDGVVIENLYPYSSDIYIHKTREGCIRNWNRKCINCLESRRQWDFHVNGMIEKYKTLKERCGKKPREYDIAYIPGFSSYR